MAYQKLQPTKVTYVDGSPTALHIRKAELILDPGQPAQKRYEFDQPVITIGTMEGNDVVLKDDTVSRNHCRIIQEEDHYVVLDLDSTNGTFINGVRVRHAYLDPGLILAVGNAQFKFSPIDQRIPVMPIAAERFGDIVGRSLKMREIFGVLEKVAPTNATVIIEGETGTGKEVVARTIHELSNRKDKPFVVFDCGAVPESLIESELFGHERGSFTGAATTRKGLFEMAHGGTIFLDEMGELSLELQPKLLRVLEQREIRRVGANKAIPINVRIVAATNRNLLDEVRDGRFREDLYYRLSVVRLTLPALRERAEDIALLVRHFLSELHFNKVDGVQKITKIDEKALEKLTGYSWPGNVRELLNCVERACSFADTDALRIEDLPDSVLNPRQRPVSSNSPDASGEVAIPTSAHLSEMPFKVAKESWIKSFEEEYIEELLQRHEGNISQAAREADIDRKYFRKLMSKHDITAKD